MLLPRCTPDLLFRKTEIKGPKMNVISIVTSSSGYHDSMYRVAWLRILYQSTLVANPTHIFRTIQVSKFQNRYEEALSLWI